MRLKRSRIADALHFLLACLLPSLMCIPSLAAPPVQAPTPLLKTGQPVDWWFVFKFNTDTFAACGGTAQRACLFGGTVQAYKNFGQQFAFASSANHTLQQGSGCVGDTTTDPLGATFNQVYNGKLFYVLWNDQFYADPIATEASPAGHSKGMLAWDKDGNGLVLQVSTPSWPGSGNSNNPRKTDGNTLGCVKDDNVLVSQHFFSLKLNKADVVLVLKALANASIVTDPSKRQIVNNGGPADIQALVKGLGVVSKSTTATKDKLSSGVLMISKPSYLNVPPWQMVSAVLGGEPLRAATWWANPGIPTTTAGTVVGCWDPSLGKPGAVEITTTGTWNGNPIGLEGVADPEGNHAKVGVSTGNHTYAIFGDLDQQGSLSPPKRCSSSQNGRGGLFYVVDDAELFSTVRDLITNDSTRLLDVLISATRAFRSKWSTGNAAENSAKLLVDLEFMRSQWTPGDKASTLYLRTLTLDLKTITDATGERTVESAQARFDLAFDDIEIKAEHCRLSGTGLGDDIPIDVLTVKNGRPISGKWVYFIPKCDEVADKPDIQRFPRMSNPHTQWDLPPGRYWMWTKEPDLDKTGERTLVKLGPGKQSATWDLSAP